MTSRMEPINTVRARHIDLLRLQGERRMFATMALSMSACAAIWSLWCLWRGMAAAAVVPGAYIALAGLMLIPAVRARNEHLTRRVLLSAGLLLPFVFQMMLGGTGPSGMVMLWCLPTLVVAVNLERGRNRYAYLGITGVLLSLFAWLDPVLPGAYPPEGLHPRTLLAFNLATSMPANFILADRMLAAQRALRRRVLEGQREIENRFVAALEERNREMQQSLDYAGRIQLALWPDRDKLGGLFEELFVHYTPKEAVGGDLIWHARVENKSYFMVLDCTGHGVPGSLMGMLIHGLLNEVVHTGRDLGAAQVVRRTQQLLDDRLDRARTGNTDGAEMAVLCFDHGRREVTCAGLGCGIIVQDGTELVHLKGRLGGSRLMTGARLDQLQEHRITVGPDTRLFLYTDGVADQFCADDRRKFTRGRLERTLREAAHLPAHAQMAHFQDTFAQWRGDTPLVDDVLLVGTIPAACWHSAELDDQEEAA